MLIFRYLAKEVFVTLAGLTSILLLIFMSNQFMQYISRAATGQIPAVFIMKLMMLEMPNLLGLLLPLGFFISLLLAYGRLYADSEMVVLQACGYGPSQLLRHSLWMASGVALLVLVIMLWLSPSIASERALILRTAGIQTLIKTIVPGRFREVPGTHEVFYVEQMNTAHTLAKNIFVARASERKGQPVMEILAAEKAFAETDAGNFEDYLILQNGHVYQGMPGFSDFQVLQFKQYKARLPHPKVDIRPDIRTATTASLWPLNNPDLAKATELQWRFSIPIMVLCLTLAAVPLSRVNPRAGKYARLLPAIALFIVYANFMFIARDWMRAGKVPLWLGMTGLHLAVLAFGLVLMRRNQVKLA